MTNRRALLGSAAAVLAQVLLPQAKAANKVVFQHDLPDVNLHDWAVTAVEVNYPPGGSSTAHRHPGITLVYVLEGEIRSKVEAARRRLIPPARCFWKLRGSSTPSRATRATRSPRGFWRCCWPRREAPHLTGLSRADASGIRAPGCYPWVSATTFRWSETTSPLIARLACAKACEVRQSSYPARQALVLQPLSTKAASACTTRRRLTGGRRRSRSGSTGRGWPLPRRTRISTISFMQKAIALAEGPVRYCESSLTARPGMSC
jgi:hypothetical protein